MAERIVVTGVGVVSPVGIGADAFDAALRGGRSGAGPITAFDADGFSSRIACEVDDAALEPARYVRPPKLLKTMSRATTFAVVAAAMARESARLGPDDADPTRVGVTLGAGGMGPVDMDLMSGQAKAILAAAAETGALTYDVPAFARAFRRLTNPLASLRGLPNLAAASIAIQQDARGPNATIATACSSGTQAIGEGLRLLQRGDADVVFAGGADAMINPVGVEGFSMLGTLSCHNEEPARASRPFDRTRDGFVIGEGAAVVVLEREAHARARGVPIRAVLAGYGVTCDAFRITDERPDADGAARAIELALRDAGLAATDVQYVNAHGTGTVMNDIIETRALRRAFGAHAGALRVSSTKSMIGHLLAAAGAAELVATVLALEGGYLPPTINYAEPDPECDLDYVPNVAREERFSAAISNSFGFGGQNACPVISRP